MRSLFACLALAAVMASASAASASRAATEAARAKLKAMSPAELSRFVQRCKRRQGPAESEQKTAEPLVDDEEKLKKAAGAQPDRKPEESLRTWTDAISGDYDNGGPGVDMCVLAVTERAMHNGMVDVLNAEATTAGAARQELLKNRITVDGVDLTGVAERRPFGTAKLGIKPGANYNANKHTGSGNPPNIAPFVTRDEQAAKNAGAAKDKAADDAGTPGKAAAKAAAAPAPKAASLLQASAGQPDASEGDKEAAAPEGDEEAAEEGPKSAYGGHVMDAPPGMNNQPPIDILPLTAVGGNLPATSHYGVLHSYVEDLGVLVKELDESEGKARKLRMMIVEKDNFLEGLQKREKLLRLDMTEHKQTLSALAAHIQAVEARIGRLKQERQLSEINAQKLQFESAAGKLDTELEGIRGVSSALGSRIDHLTGGISSNMQSEMEAMRRSVQPAVAAGMRVDDDAAQAAMEANEAALLQRRSRSLRGADSA